MAGKYRRALCGTAGFGVAPLVAPFHVAKRVRLPLPVINFEFRTFPMMDGQKLGTRGAWGEAFWTSRDICLSNPVLLPDPLQQMVDEYSRRLEREFLFGPDTEEGSREYDTGSPLRAPAT